MNKKGTVTQPNYTFKVRAMKTLNRCLSSGSVSLKAELTVYTNADHVICLIQETNIPNQWEMREKQTEY